MRIARLNLLRYGALTDRELVFRPGAAIHVVHGPNEAGKSTALAALSDLLFGFGARKTHDFLHEGTLLRVAATLEARDGRRIAFRRRRGNKNTLLSDDDEEEPLADNALLAFLGSLSRPVFERAFGLNSVRLRAGSEEMLASGGELGAMLFAASSGILGVAAARIELEAEADSIFTPRKSAQRTFYQLLDRHEAARMEERGSELRATDWKRLNDDVTRLEGEHEEKTRKRAAQRNRRSEIESLTKLKPVLAEMDYEAGQLEAFSDIASLPTHFGPQLSLALAEFERTRIVFETAQASAERIRASIKKIEVKPELAAALGTVVEVYDRRGAVEDDQIDLPRVAAERDQFSAQLGEMAGRLGMHSARLEERQPTDAEIARIEECLARLAGVERRIEEINRRVAEDEEALRRLDEERPKAALVDPESWRNRLAALRPDLDRLGSLHAAEAELASRRRRMEERAGRLDPPVSDLATLALVPLPSRSDIADRRDALHSAHAGAETIESRLKADREEIAELDRKITAEDRSSLPTPEAIAKARAARDAALAALLGEEGRPLSADEVARGVQSAQALTSAADILVDRVRQEAEKLALIASARERRAAASASAKAREVELADAKAGLAALQADYEALFSAVGIKALSPDRMLVWLSETGQLLELREEIETEAERLKAAGQAGDSLLQPLREIAESIGVPGPQSLPMSALIRAVEERLGAIQRIWDDSRENAISRGQCETRLERFSGLRAEAETERTELLAQLQGLSAPLGVGEAASPVAVEAALGVWKKVPDLRLERENRDRRVRGMERDIAAFEAAVAELVGQYAPDLAPLPPAQAIGMLNERARQADAAARREREVRAELGDAEEALALASQGHDAARISLLELLGDAASLEEAAALVERLRLRDGLQEKLDACRNRFRQIAPDRDEEALRQELQAMDPVEAATELARLEAEEASLDTEINEVYAQLSALRTERVRLEQSRGSEAAAFERRAVEAGMVDAVRQWTVLKLASLLLGEAIEKQRDAAADPALDRAGTYFRTLTSGAFIRLSKRFAEDDTAELVAIREGGEEIRLTGMSDGTVDQLHLALRLAYLADYCGSNEPVPFIADDLFQTFDDARTAAAIEALGASSDLFQPIVFTHHTSVADAARSVFGERADILSL
ncbi:MAG: AAA family ATPase [Rhizobiaceae bacterium]